MYLLDIAFVEGLFEDTGLISTSQELNGDIFYNFKLLLVCSQPEFYNKFNQKEFIMKVKK